jgi:hypothetical protein
MLLELLEALILKLVRVKTDQTSGRVLDLYVLVYEV